MYVVHKVFILMLTVDNLSERHDIATV